LNDPTFVAASKAFAARLLREDSTEQAANPISRRVNAAMRIVLGRDADPQERSVLSELYRQELSRFQTDREACEAFLGQHETLPIAWPAETSPPERAAWSSVARAVLNLHETLYRP
jgi:hypothetical protein